MFSGIKLFLPFLQNTDETDKKDREKASSRISATSSPTLAELNARDLTSQSKRPASAPARDLGSHITPVYTPVGDSCTTNELSPRVGFVEGDATFDNLSASFKSLYNSLFGPPMASSSRDGNFSRPPITLSTSTSTDSLSLGMPSSPTCFEPFSKQYDPQFTSLMDGLKDIAESNHWDKLSPSQIQNLRDSFHEGGHERLGMDPDSFAELSLSFSQFLSQLDGHLLPPTTSSCGLPGDFLSSPVHTHIHTAQMPPPSYTPFSRRDLTTHQNISPPITALPSMAPPVVTQPHHYTTTYSTYLPPLHDPSPSLATAAASSQSPPSEHLPSFKSAATDLFDDNDDDDDFDWSKFM